MKYFLTIFLLCLLSSPSFCEERLNAGVSYDFKTEKVKERLLDLDTDFIDLNYTADFSAINVLSQDDLIYKKEKTKIFNPAYFDRYNISLNNGTTEGKIDKSTLEALCLTNPENKDYMLMYSIELKKKNELERALHFANKAVEIDPDYALSHFLKGDILRRMGKLKEAADEYIYTAQINPLCSDAYYNVAKILESLENYKLALDYYKLAYSINPDDEELKKIISSYYFMDL